MSSLLYSPSSSPSSSPSLCAVDSSPPSSPELAPLNTETISPGLPHPFAASTKAVKEPPLYEKHGTKRPRKNDRWQALIDSDGESENVYDDEEPVRRPNGATDWSPNTHAHSKVVDPLSASAKEGWTPPVREKKMRIHSRTTSGVLPSHETLSAPTSTLQDAFVYKPPCIAIATKSNNESPCHDMMLPPSPVTDKTRRESTSSERRRWDEAISDAVASADGFIDLSASGVMGTVLTYIPPSVGDLASLVLLESDMPDMEQTVPRRAGTPEPGCEPSCGRKRVFTRSATVPTRQPGQSIFDYSPLKATSKAKSSAHVPFMEVCGAVPKPTGIQLILANNTISSLPVELFSVVSLTVLNLRGNMLRHIPSQIVQLVNLRELNLKSNRLRYLPAELLGMTLNILELDQNPWFEFEEVLRFSGLDSSRAAKGPDDNARTSQSTPLSGTGISQVIGRVSDVKAGCPVAPLGEYCLRVLLAPSTESATTLPLSGTASEISTSATSPSPQCPPWPRYETNLQACHHLPLTGSDHYPPHFLDALRACLPAAVARPDTRTHMQGHAVSPGTRTKKARVSFLHEDTSPFVVSSKSTSSGPLPRTPPQRNISPTYHHMETETGDHRSNTRTGINVGFGICPSPVHYPPNTRIFTKHVEERFSWEDVIAGVPVKNQRRVAVLWRGCSRGCLRFLSSRDAEEDRGDDTEQAEVEEHHMDIDEEMIEVQSENGFGVEEMDLSGGLDDFD